MQSLMPPWDDETATYSAWVTRGFDPWTREAGAGNVYVAIDQFSGEVVYDGIPGEGNTFDQVWDDWSFPLHTGDFGGTLTRVAVDRAGPDADRPRHHRPADVPHPPPQAGPAAPIGLGPDLSTAVFAPRRAAGTVMTAARAQPGRRLSAVGDRCRTRADPDRSTALAPRRPTGRAGRVAAREGPAAS